MTVLMANSAAETLLTRPTTIAQPRPTRPPMPDTAWGALRVIALSVAEARPAVLGIFALRYLSAVTLSVSGEGTRTTLHTIIGAAAGLFVWTAAVAFVYLLNGTTDVIEDQINGSHRPIARGDLTTGQARVVLSGLAVITLGTATACGTRTVVMAAAMLVLGYLYSGAPFRLKRRPAAAATILVLAGLLTYAAGWAEVTANRPDIAVAALAVVMALWMGLVGAVAKDFADVAGDVRAGCNLSASYRGDLMRRARCATAALVLGGLAVVGGVTELPSLRWAGFALALGALAIARECVTTTGAQTRAVLRRPYRAFMVTQYGVHVTLIVGLVTGLLLT